MLTLCPFYGIVSKYYITITSMTSLGTFSLYGFSEEEKERLKKLKDKLTETATEGLKDPNEKQIDLTERLKEGLSREELRELMALRDKFKSKFLEVYPEALEKGPNLAEKSFFETLGMTDIETAYKSKHDQLNIFYHFAESDRSQLRLFFRNREVPVARQLQIVKILRATGSTMILDDASRLVKTNFLSTDEAVEAFIKYFPAVVPTRDIVPQMTLELAMRFSEFFGEDPRKISAFFLLLEDEEAVLALRRIDDLRPALESDLNHLIYWVETVRHNHHTDNACTLGFLKPDTVERICRLLPDYSERNRFLNALFHNLPATPESSNLRALTDNIDSKSATNDQKQEQWMTEKTVEDFYDLIGRACLDLNHLFIKPDLNPKAPSAKKRRSYFDQEAFLQVFVLVAELHHRDKYAKFSASQIPGSVEDLKKQVHQNKEISERAEAN